MMISFNITLWALIGAVSCPAPSSSTDDILMRLSLDVHQRTNRAEEGRERIDGLQGLWDQRRMAAGGLRYQRGRVKGCTLDEHARANRGPGTEGEGGNG